MSTIGVFSDFMRSFYDAEVGAYTSVTKVEIDKQTYNVKACIRKMMIDRIGRGSIVPYGDNTPTLFNLSDNLRTRFGRSTESFVCKFSKPDKDEMTIYFSNAGFISKVMQHPGDVWCIYFKAGDNTPWFDFVESSKWSYISDPVIGDTMIEPDEVEGVEKKVHELKYDVDINALKISEVPVPVSSKPAKKKSSNHIVSTAKMKAILKNQKIKGTRGEEIVVRYEKERLNNAHRPDLAARVEWVGKKSDGYGYDIESFEIDPATGKEKQIFIEVKTTSMLSANTPFYISENEKNVSKQKGDSYYIYRVFAMTRKNPEVCFFRIKGAVDNNFLLSPASYLAYIK